ncbi:MAG: 30S ribosomal protein S17 [Candidatus Omnitrophica bacterium]|nr:30S ribosomal protein S17 [Candidatus Omnitrophota bacterium]
MGNERGKKRERVGVVISDKMNKTRVVQLERQAQHPGMNKSVRRFIKLKMHDEKNQSKTGDVVRVMATRPLSKEKSWRLVEIISANKE